jgi:putative endonuclease
LLYIRTFFTMGGLDPPIQGNKLCACHQALSTYSPVAAMVHCISRVTSDLLGRMEQHREGIGSAFVKKYGVCRLVHFEEYPLYTDAMRRETSHRRWKRAWKLALIEKHNPQWIDLLEHWHR